MRSLRISFMQSATLAKEIPTVSVPESNGAFPVEGTSAAEFVRKPAVGRLNAATGSLVGIALGAGLWTMIIGSIAILRH